MGGPLARVAGRGDAGLSRGFSPRCSAIFAGVALLLAGVGIYGVTSYGVAQQTHEIGIRLALGASGDRVLREVVGGGVAPDAGRRRDRTGRRGGDGPARRRRCCSASRRSIRWRSPAPRSILGAVSIAACYIPARRASRVDPVVALAEE